MHIHHDNDVRIAGQIIGNPNFRYVSWPTIGGASIMCAGLGQSLQPETCLVIRIVKIGKNQSLLRNVQSFVRKGSDPTWGSSRSRRASLRGINQSIKKTRKRRFTSTNPLAYRSLHATAQQPPHDYALRCLGHDNMIE